MGIERFFSSINRNFNVVDVINIEQKINCNCFLVDFNSILHTVSAKIIKELNGKNNSSYDNYKIDDIQEIIILEMNDYLINLFKIVNCNLIYLAFDGVPSFSKIIEQKKRRFIGNFIEQLLSKYSLPFAFNKSSISPGTIFMEKVSKFLKEQNYHKNIIISDANENGEGEFKILDYISKNNLTDFIIYSPDADLIILSMIIWSNSNNVTLKILRFDQNTQILNLIYINHLVDYLTDYFKDKVNNSIDTKKYIKDLSFIFTVFGNDFLPKIENININMDFYLVLDAYIINFIDNGYLLNDKLDIIPKSLYFYLSFLNKYENFLLERNANLYKYQNFNYAQTINLYLDLKKEKFNPAMVFYIDFGTDFTKDTKYGKLQYYFYNCEKLSKITNYQFKNNFNKGYIEGEHNLKYQKLIKFEYKSSVKKHLVAMKDLSPREKESYLINNKLDKYYTLFNPNNKFFNTLKKQDYYKTNKPKEMVQQYLKGLKWLVNYYFKRTEIDETWFYNYNMSPLLSDFINYFDPNLLNYKFKNTLLNISPIEQLLYITPIQMNNINEFIDIIDATTIQKNKIIKFIESNPQLFYNLDELYYSLSTNNLTKDLFDCSSATFISKCHYHILNEIKSIKQFRFL